MTGHKLTVGVSVASVLALVAGIVLLVGAREMIASARAGGDGAPGQQDSAQAFASASAAAATFAPPTGVPAGAVPTSSESATRLWVPADLSVRVSGTYAQTPPVLADQITDMVTAWVQAWAEGDVHDAVYGAWCVYQCHALMDPTITEWARAGLRPAGTLAVYRTLAVYATGLATSAQAAICLDDSDIVAVDRSGDQVADSLRTGPTLYVLGLLDDTSAGRWLVTEGYHLVGDPYCTDTAATSAS